MGMSPGRFLNKSSRSARKPDRVAVDSPDRTDNVLMLREGELVVEEVTCCAQRLDF